MTQRQQSDGNKPRPYPLTSAGRRLTADVIYIYYNITITISVVAVYYEAAAVYFDFTVKFVWYLSETQNNEFKLLLNF